MVVPQMDVASSSNKASVQSTPRFIHHAPRVSATAAGEAMVVISGGTAVNPFVDTLLSLSPCVIFCLGISDDGGSTSQIVNVIGGPAIGDIRSRLTRLVPDNVPDLAAMKRLMSHRLSQVDPEDAARQWQEVLAKTHP